VSDNTEAAAGWYWQFNLKQGYKHDGTSRTPNDLWLPLNLENSDWTENNDPCSLLLGNAWRIPSFTEWANVDAIGNWANWNGPFSSGLQMHAAGSLLASDGSMGSRGSNGNYWSSTQVNESQGWKLNFAIDNSGMVNGSFRSNGHSIRCVRD
jgi:hypothetical protein